MWQLSDETLAWSRGIKWANPRRAVVPHENAAQQSAETGQNEQKRILNGLPQRSEFAEDCENFPTGATPYGIRSNVN